MNHSILKYRMLFTSVLLVFLVMLLFMLWPRYSYSRSPAFDKENLAAALKYLEVFPDNKKIFIFPSSQRNIEVTDQKDSIKKVLKSYLSGSSVEYTFKEPIVFSQILVISNKNFMKMSFDDRARHLKGVLFPSQYILNILYSDKNESGCYAKSFQSRDVWQTAGYVITANDNTVDSSGAARICLSAALDYINGFPIVNEPFEYQNVPSENIRAPIMLAIYDCAHEGQTLSIPVDAERSRGAVTALPSMMCVKKKIREKLP